MPGRVGHPAASGRGRSRTGAPPLPDFLARRGRASAGLRRIAAPAGRSAFPRRSAVLRIFSTATPAAAAAPPTRPAGPRWLRCCCAPIRPPGRPERHRRRSRPFCPSRSAPAEHVNPVRRDPLGRLAPIRFGRAICGDLACRRAARMVDRQRARRLCRRHHRAEPDAALSRAAGRAGRSAARPRPGPCQGRCAHCSRTAVPIRCSPTAGRAARSSPKGYLALESFHLDGTIPVWRFRCGGRIVEQRIWMEPGADTVYVGLAARRRERRPGAASVGRAARQWPRPPWRHLAAGLRAARSPPTARA